MDTLVAIVFDSEEQAFKGADALRDLDRDGDVLVYSAAVIGKDADGKVAIKRAVDEGPVGTALGMIVGAMVGVLAGPAAVAGGAVAAGSAAAASIAASGMAAGSMTGGMLGLFRDLYEAGVDDETLSQVSQKLEPGKTAVVASVDEVWTTPLDVKMKEAGGTVIRKARIDVADEQIEREIEALDAELKELDEELDQAADDAKTWISGKIAAGKKKMSELNDKALNKLESMQAEFDAKQAELDKRIVASVGAAKDKLERRKAKIKDDYEKRSAKLKQASQLAKEALT